VKATGCGGGTEEESNLSTGNGGRPSPTGEQPGRGESEVDQDGHTVRYMLSASHPRPHSTSTLYSG
jgi:hypothetical protein